MNEKSTKRREWVKNFAIIFLTIMLALTFFSNTIMNYSLPEVATQYVQSGTITAKVRGTGTIEASDPYNLVINETRVIESVNVKNGDEVEKGDPLFVLEDGDSTELKAAEEALRAAETALDDMMLAYQTSILDGSLSAETINGIQTGNTNSMSGNLAKVQEAKTKVDDAQNAVNTCKANVDNLTKQKELLSNNNENKDMSAEQNALTEAKKAVANATAKKEAAHAKMTALNEWIAQADQALAAKQTAEAAVAQAQNLVIEVSENLEIAKQRWEAAENDPDLTDLEKQEIKTAYEDAQTAAQSAATNKKNAEESLKSAATTSKGFEQNRSGKISELSNANSEYVNATNELESAINSENNAQAALENKQNDKSTENQIASITNQLTEATSALTAANLALEQAKADQTQVLADVAGELNLEDKSGKIADQRALINEKKEEVEEIRSKTIDTVVTAPVKGTITSMNYVAGETTKAGETAAVIQVADKGFSVSFSVTNEQAKKVNVGDIAELQNAWYFDEDVKATLASIKADTANPAKNKILVFNVTGNVTAGQSLSLSVGQKSQDYELVVPNSAVREDNNGKFILIVESKSSPLGNRYFATRVDVEVLASDDMLTAVSGGLFGREYVITTSTKPVEAGKQVRLTE